MIKNTPEPWSIQKYDTEWLIVGPEGILIGSLFLPDEDIPIEMAEANAQLIQMAPIRIKVEVRGGVAYCDDPRVDIIDYDDRDEEKRDEQVESAEH